MCRPSKQDGQRFGKVLTLRCCRQAFVEIFLESNARPRLETISFVNRPAQSVAQTIRQRDIVSHLPNVLPIDVVLFSCKTAKNWSTGLLRRAVNTEVEVCGVLRQPAEHSRKRMSRIDQRTGGDSRAYRKAGQKRKPCVNRVGDHVAGTSIERLVSDSVVKCCGKVFAVVPNDTNVGTESDGVVALNPREVVGKVMDRGCTTKSSRKEV